MDKKYTLVALCAIGSEKILANEIKLLGYEIHSNKIGRIVFIGGEDAFYRCNLCLRTADRLYFETASFMAEDFDSLFEGVKKIPWQDYIKKDAKVTVDKVRTHKSKLSSEHSVQKTAHKAIYEKLCASFSMRTLPESGENIDVRVYIQENEVSVLLDLSGAPLFKRGYRIHSSEAPLRESAAASLLQMMLWRRKYPLHDPFCGSGTILCEAVLYACNAAPGFGRQFALNNLRFFQQEREVNVRKNEAAKIKIDGLMRITGSDIDGNAVELAKVNAEHVCVTIGRALQLIGSDAKIPRPNFYQSDVADLNDEYGEGILLGNPPYGERLGNDEEVRELYRKIGSTVFTQFSKRKIGFLSAHPDFEKEVTQGAPQGTASAGESPFRNGIKMPKKKCIKSGKLDTVLYLWD